MRGLYRLNIHIPIYKIHINKEHEPRISVNRTQTASPNVRRSEHVTEQSNRISQF